MGPDKVDLSNRSGNGIRGNDDERPALCWFSSISIRHRIAVLDGNRLEGSVQPSYSRS